MGVVNSGIPFICYAYAVMSITTGLSSILNSTTPLFGALIAWVWFKPRPCRSPGLGLVFRCWGAGGAGGSGARDVSSQWRVAVRGGEVPSGAGSLRGRCRRPGPRAGDSRCGLRHPLG